MSASAYAWVYEEPFHTIFFSVTTIISGLSNALLLYIIFTTTSNSIGSYRYLLAVFAICDIVTSIAHMTLQPIVHMTSRGIYVWPRYGPLMIEKKSFDTVCILIFVATYYQTFLILSYHYVYRLKTVTSGLTRSFTDNWPMSRWVKLAALINVVYIAIFVVTCALAFPFTNETRALAPPEIQHIYGINVWDINRGGIVISVRRLDYATGQEVVNGSSLAALILLVAMFGGTGCVCLYCIWRINGVIRSSDNHLTIATRKMQMDLFRALLIQSAVPMLFSYLPLATILVFPAASGISLGAFGNVLFSITAIFPSIDAFFVLFFIGRFRTAVIRLFRLPFDIGHSHSGE